MLSVDIKRIGYDAEHSIVQDVRFQLGAGQLMGLIGPNGAGKSSTIKAVMGLLKDMDGKVAFDGPKAIMLMYRSSLCTMSS